MDLSTIEPNPPGPPPRPYLIFRLAGLEYGIEVARVRELRPLKALERFASDGALIKGVALSRGVIMPLVDMRVAFGAGADAAGRHTDVIILELAHCVMGMVVDGVTDVVALSPSQIGPIPGLRQPVDYLIGLGESAGRRLILLDIDKLMSVAAPSRPVLRAVPAIPSTPLPARPDPL